MFLIRRCRFGRFLKCILVVYTLGTIFFLGYSQINIGNFDTKHSVWNRTALDLLTKTQNKSVKYQSVKRTNPDKRLGGLPQEPGVGGYIVDLSRYELSQEVVNQIQANKRKHGFNTYVSDIVSIRRKLRDTRTADCKSKTYPSDLPAVSVVILFRDEWPSILLRTAYSVLDTTPEHLLKEIILVDDGSENQDLKVKVDLHVKAVDTFTLIRNSEPEGLMKARQRGIEAATANYFVVLDGHIEVGPGWLEPLISRLLEYPNACLTPHVDRIDPNHFGVKIRSHYSQKNFPFFDPLTLNQDRVIFKESYLETNTIGQPPFYYGMVQGMAIAMRKNFFLQLGGFDPGMHIWGSEQVELSLKVWMCGGRVEVVPCSGVAHMYRSSSWIQSVNNTPHVALNSRRVAEVWLDPPQRKMFRAFIGAMTHNYGTVSDRIRIRDKNKCENYTNFVDKIHEFSDVFLPKTVQYLGPIYNREFDKCLDLAFVAVPFKYNLTLYPCHGNPNQIFVLSEENQIRSFNFLHIKMEEVNEVPQIKVAKAPIVVRTQESTWLYNTDGTIVNYKTSLCVTIMYGGKLELKRCSGRANQLWKWKRFETP